MRIVIMADSLAMPRQKEEGDIPFEATYPYLLDSALRNEALEASPVIIERGMRRRTIEYVLDEWFELVELRNPDVLIVHVGVVDCAPRIFLRRERRFVESFRLAFVRKAILDFVHKHRRSIIRMRPRVYVPEERFSRLVGEVVAKASQAKMKSVIFINIITPPAALEDRSPGFIENVRRYNEILKSHCTGLAQLIDVDAIVRANGGPEQMTTDGIHINRTGHQLLALELQQAILKANNRDRAAMVSDSVESVGGNH